MMRKFSILLSVLVVLVAFASMPVAGQDKDTKKDTPKDKKEEKKKEEPKIFVKVLDDGDPSGTVVIDIIGTETVKFWERKGHKAPKPSDSKKIEGGTRLQFKGYKGVELLNARTGFEDTIYLSKKGVLVTGPFSLVIESPAYKKK